ncbi:est1 DNA/RNA binding domain-containing protein [Sarocladium implicatum]|nr:est1 DNA/RNA binding domain-containing protein [Sarocladium implicatum]
MSHITQGFEAYKRRTANQQSTDKRDASRRDLPNCPLCKSQAPSDFEGFRRHVLEDAPKHDGLNDEAAIEEAFSRITIRQQSGLSPEATKTRAKRETDTLPVPDDASESDLADMSLDPPETSRPGSRKRPSPATSTKKNRGSPPSSVTDRSRARVLPSSARNQKSGRKQAAGRLWHPEDGVTKTSSRPHASARPSGLFPSSKELRTAQQQSVERTDSHPHNPDYNDPEFMIRQPMTRPISQEQIVHEVKTIYAGLVMVENKCVEVNASQTENPGEKSDLTKEQWQALITLHRTLLHEHHDFFLASQHPSANSALKRLAAKYSMPARMWRHGIHSFLELLRHNLPESREYMLTFIYLAYSIMALLYETVPAFDETWIECLGDLSRYRMAIEEEDIRDREIWTGVSRHWYSKTSEKLPTTGRLYHHLAILARPNALQQLFCYSKSLCVVIPFPSARESILTLFDPLMDTEHAGNISVDAAFVRVLGVVFTGKTLRRELIAWTNEFLSELDGHIGRSGRRWIESGYFIGISLSCSLLGFGDEKNVLMRTIKQKPEETDVTMEETPAETSSREKFETALSFAIQTWSIVIRRWGDLNVLGCHHTMLVLLLHMSRYPAAMAYIEDKIPWKLISVMLNYLLETTEYRPKLEASEMEDAFKAPANDSHRPLPDDYALRGLIYAEEYLPKSMFPEDLDEDEKYIELSSMADDRVKRILWIGCKIARARTWLIWDAAEGRFDATIRYDDPIEEGPIPIPHGRRSTPPMPGVES